MTKFKRLQLAFLSLCACRARFCFVKIKLKGGIFVATMTWSEYASQSSFNSRQLHFLHSSLEERHPELLADDYRLSEPEWTIIVTHTINRWKALVAATFEDWA